jgi:hypothetical protein
MTKSSTKVAGQKARRHKPRKAAAKIAENANRKVALETVSAAAQRKAEAVSELVGGSTLHDTVRGVAERNVAQTREIYERSKNTIEAMLDSWQKSFGAAGQGAVALTRKIFDLTDRNINNSFDLATALAGARDPAEVVELQIAYWRKQLADLTRSKVGAGS